MIQISEGLVGKTWLEIGGLTNLSEIKKLGADFSKQQPSLVEFVMEFTKNLRPDVRDLGFYVALVVWQCFERAFSKRLKKIPSQKIIDAYEAFDSELGSFVGAHDKFVQRKGETLAEYAQPAILLYVLETLFEEEGDVELTEDEQGELFTILKVVSDCLCNSIPEGIRDEVPQNLAKI